MNAWTATLEDPIRRARDATTAAELAWLLLRYSASDRVAVAVAYNPYADSLQLLLLERRGGRAAKAVQERRRKDILNAARVPEVPAVGAVPSLEPLLAAA